MHDSRQGCFFHLYNKMHMVARQAIGVDTMPKAGYAFLQQEEKSTAVRLVMKNVLPGIAS
ncbi:MAG: hypothetical protein AB7F21_01360 [Desulfuromonadales bacterium]